MSIDSVAIKNIEFVLDGHPTDEDVDGDLSWRPQVASVQKQGCRSAIDDTHLMGRPEIANAQRSVDEGGNGLENGSS